MKWENDTFGLVLRMRQMVYSSKDFVFLFFSLLLAGYKYYSFASGQNISGYINKVIVKQSTEDVFYIAKLAEKLIPKDEMILSNSYDDYSGYIQFLSRRSLYVHNGTLPSSEEGIKIWYRRMKETEGIDDWSSNDLAIFMKKHQLCYAVVKVKKGDGVDSESFNILKQTNNYKLLKLKQ